MTLFKTLAVAGMAAAVLAGSLMPVQAMPRMAAPAAGIETNVDADVTLVQYRRHGGGWYGGYRGHRDYRPGYRRHNGYWFPLAAFGAGALIGGAIAAQPRYVEPAPAYDGGDDINPRHYEWCAERYRSYDAYSNSFQPNYGPRQTCYSPYF